MLYFCAIFRRKRSFLINLSENYKCYKDSFFYAKFTTYIMENNILKGGIIMLTVIKNILRYVRSDKVKILTEEEIEHKIKHMSKEEKQMYARLYRY